MKVVIIGSNGQLGNDLTKEFWPGKEPVAGLTHTDIEITDIDSCRKTLMVLQSDVIVNTAAYHHVDHCEENPERAYAINALGPKNLALISNELRATLIHISTDYVFSGTKRSAYIEEDLPLPLNVYGNTKLAGEHFVQTIARQFFVLRTSGLYGKTPCRAKGHNFVELMLKLAKERDEIRVVNDEILTPTSTSELARQVVKISDSEDYGLYHSTAEGSCSWYEFAREIFSLINSDVTLNMADPGEFPTKTPRPKYSVLENRRLKTLNHNIMEDWQLGLVKYFGSIDK